MANTYDITMKIGTGFSDEDLKNHHKVLKDKTIDSAKVLICPDFILNVTVLFSIL